MIATSSSAARTIAADREIAAVAEPVPSDDGKLALLVATPRHDGESAQAKAAVDRLRDQLGALLAVFAGRLGAVAVLAGSACAGLALRLAGLAG